MPFTCTEYSFIQGRICVRFQKRLLKVSEFGADFRAVTHGMFFFCDLVTVGCKSITLNLGNLCL